MKKVQPFILSGADAKTYTQIQHFMNKIAYIWGSKENVGNLGVKKIALPQLKKNFIAFPPPQKKITSAPT